MKYLRCGYKYRLAEREVVATEIYPLRDCRLPGLLLETNGRLTLDEFFCWDGATFALDTPSFMRASAVHDAFYRLFRAGMLNAEEWRDDADLLLRGLAREDGMWRLRVWWVFLGVRLFAGGATDSDVDTIYTAP